MDTEKDQTSPPAESRMKYFKRRSAEAIGLLVQMELRVAATRQLAIDPDAKQDYFVAMATEAWREAVGEIACRSVSSYPFTTPPPSPKLKTTASQMAITCKHGWMTCAVCAWKSGHHASDYESPSAAELKSQE